MRSNVCAGFVLLVSLSILVVTVSVAVAKGCMAGRCHQELAQVKYMHGPVAAEMAGVNGCVMCHLPSGEKCGVQRAGSYTIKSKGLCVTCHAKGAGTRHSAAEIEAKCLQCHDPHGSDLSRYMLRTGAN